MIEILRGPKAQQDRPGAQSAGPKLGGTQTYLCFELHSQLDTFWSAALAAMCNRALLLTASETLASASAHFACNAAISLLKFTRSAASMFSLQLTVACLLSDAAWPALFVYAVNFQCTEFVA